MMTSPTSARRKRSASATVLRARTGGPRAVRRRAFRRRDRRRNPCLRQLLDIYEFFAAPVLAVMEVPRESLSSMVWSMLSP